MSIFEGGLVLERALPEGVLTGLLSGEYSLHGGVIRNTSGQIVRHLVPAASQALNPFGFISAVPSLFNTYQLHKIAEMTQQVLAISTATMALSGLNLSVSAVGFKMVRDSLKRVETKLRELDTKTTWIKAFLDTSRTARLLSAIDELSQLPSSGEHRMHILLASRDKLGEVSKHYLQHWDESNDLTEAMAYQHYFCMAFIAKSRCSAELEMFDKAISEFQDGLEEWQSRARSIMTDRIFGDNRSRYLSNDYLEQVPVAKIAGWMDFAYNNERGYAWIDVLRGEYEPIPPKGLFRKLIDKKNDSNEHLEKITYLDNLVSRNQVFLGHESQLQFLKDNEITPTQFQEKITPLTHENNGNQVLILAPSDLTEQAA